MKYAKYLIAFSALFYFSCYGDDDGPKENPCQVVHDNGAVFETGYELIDGNCACPDGKYSAYGTCRELKESEWFGVSTGCPCVDTLFLWLKDFNNEGQAEFTLNSDIFDSFNSDPDYELQKNRTSGTFLLDYFTLSDGDSIASPNWVGPIRCQIDGTGPEFDETTIFGKFSPDNDTLFAKFIYRDGFDRSMVLDSCNVVFTR